MPSLRILAQENSIAINTAAKAYRALAAEGVLTVKDRSAYFVSADNAPVRASGARRRRTDEGRYARRGVSHSKDEVHAAVDKIDRGLFPGAFCKITADHLTGDARKCNLIHADGSGTKSILAYLYWRETGDASVFRGIAQDSIVMNIDDLLCAGVTGGILLSNTINRNAKAIPGEVLKELIDGTESFIAELRSHGIDIHSGGGETADVGDLTGTLTVDSCAVAVIPRKTVIDNHKIKPGLAIVGLASAGKALYERAENSGIGSNGLTSARHDLLCKRYRKRYPETWDKNIDPKLIYCGPYKLEDALPDSTMTVGQALLSPTRTYAPVIRAMLDSHRSAISGLVHCSGGGQTKCLRFGSGVHMIKDNLLPVPPVFKAIRKASKTKRREMYAVYNMGHRMEIYCQPQATDALIALAASYGIEAAVIGRTERSHHPLGANHLTIATEGKTLSYGLD